MKRAKEYHDPATGGLYYDHTTIYKEDVGRKQIDKLSKAEKVNHPAHYNAGKIEVIDAIVDWELDFIEGNVVKYVTRAKHKGDQLGDLKKARWYLDYLIKNLEK
jgi:hypothetical protein